MLIFIFFKDPYIPYTVSVVAFNTIDINEIGQPTSKDFSVQEGSK